MVIILAIGLTTILVFQTALSFVYTSLCLFDDVTTRIQYIFYVYVFIYRWQGDYNGQVKKWFPVNFTEETVMKAKPDPPVEVSLPFLNFS